MLFAEAQIIYLPKIPVAVAVVAFERENFSLSDDGAHVQKVVQKGIKPPDTQTDVEVADVVLAI